MSLSAVSPCTSPHVSQLPDRFTINFSRDELVIALRWCERFAPADAHDSVAVVSLGATERTWTFVEDNVMGYYINYESSPCVGVVPVTHSLLAIATDATQEDAIVIEFDVSMGLYRLHVEQAVIELPIPCEWDLDPRFALVKPVSVLAKPADVVAIGRAFMTPHLYRPTTTDSLEYPFIDCHITDGMLTLHRSWEKWGGKKLTTSIPVNGVYPGSFSFAPEVVVREMYYVDTYCEGSVVIEIATTGNPVVNIRGPRCGFSFIASEEYIRDARQNIIDELVDVSCDLEVLPGNEWVSTVQVVSQGHAVDITIIPNISKSAEYVRVTHRITEEIPWTLELAEELNAWNRASGDSKFVRSDNGLFVIADIAIANISQLPAAIDNVVAQSGKVKDFIAIFQ